VKETDIPDAKRATRWQRVYREAPQFIRYGLVGILLMIAYLGLAQILAEVVGISPVLASPVSFMLCVPLAYLGQSIVVFRAPWGDRAQQKRFLATTLVGFIIATSAAPLLALVADVPSYVNFVVVSLLVPLANFVVFRFWVFRGP
jgi:putative flippase GtrA